MLCERNLGYYHLGGELKPFYLERRSAKLTLLLGMDICA